MRMAGRVLSCCVALFLTLTTVSAVKKLNSINDLKKINFGQSVPKHSLLLLHWFANAVDIDGNNVIHLTFNPNSEDYGSHHYGNFEEILPLGHQYYTIGNLNQYSPRQLPDYVLHPRPEHREGNRDRIIIRVREQNRGGLHWRIDRVYLTQHYEDSEHQGEYDPDYTYEITTKLLREIRQFSVQGNQPLRDLRDRFRSNASESQLQDIRNTWGHLAGLGLLLFIVIQNMYYVNQMKYRPQHNPVYYSNQAARNTDYDFFNNICACFGLLVLLFFVVVLGIFLSVMEK